MGDLSDIRDRITRLTLAAGLPSEVWSELCKIDSDFRAAEPIWTLVEMTAQRDVLLHQLMDAKQKAGAAQTASAERVRDAVEQSVEAESARLGERLLSLHATKAIADRVAAQLTAAPPGHVCPVPYGLGPEDVDEIEAARNFVGRHGGFRSTVDVLGKILAAHRAPTPTIEPLPEVIGCGAVGCVSSIKKHLLPAGWLLIEGRWRCPRCKVIATSGAS